MFEILIQKTIASWQEVSSFFDNGLMIAFLLAAFMYASYTDMLEFKIYDKFNLFLMGARLVFVFIPIYGKMITLDSYLGGIIGVLVLLIPAVVFLQKMGGDIKFIGVIGTYLGSGLTLFLLILGCIYMLIFSLIRKIITKEKVKHLKTPMAPFFMLSFFTLLIISMY